MSFLFLILLSVFVREILMLLKGPLLMGLRGSIWKIKDLGRHNVEDGAVGGRGDGIRNAIISKVSNRVVNIIGFTPFFIPEKEL